MLSTSCNISYIEVRAFVVRVKIVEFAVDAIYIDDFVVEERTILQNVST